MSCEWPWHLPQRDHTHYHYGIRPPKTMIGIVFWDLFHNGSVVLQGSSWFYVTKGPPKFQTAFLRYGLLLGYFRLPMRAIWGLWGLAFGIEVVIIANRIFGDIMRWRSLKNITGKVLPGPCVQACGARYRDLYGRPWRNPWRNRISLNPRNLNAKRHLTILEALNPETRTLEGTRKPLKGFRV